MPTYTCACCGREMAYWEQKVLRIIPQVECRNVACAMYKLTNTPDGHQQQAAELNKRTVKVK